jgi:hypothetical protein
LFFIAHNCYEAEEWCKNMHIIFFACWH